MIIFSILLLYILNEGLSIISNAEYDPSGNSNLLFHVGADILNLLFCMTSLYFFMYKC